MRKQNIPQRHTKLTALVGLDKSRSSPALVGLDKHSPGPCSANRINPLTARWESERKIPGLLAFPTAKVIAVGGSKSQSHPCSSRSSFIRMVKVG